MANRKRVTSPDGRVLVKHPKVAGTAWVSAGTLPHHRRAGWVLASVNDDQPAPAGASGTPTGGGSDDPKENT